MNIAVDGDRQLVGFEQIVEPIVEIGWPFNQYRCWSYLLDPLGEETGRGRTVVAHRKEDGGSVETPEARIEIIYVWLGG
jgi:hypothetical protein